MMPQAKSKPLLLTAATSIVLLTASGCYDPYYVSGNVGYQTPRVGTVVTYQQPWYDYYYYPSVGVYFNYRTGYYYHHDRGRWNHVRRLPRHINIYPQDRVHLRMRSDRPYLKHHEHQRKYKGYRKGSKRRYNSERKHERREQKSSNKRYRQESGKRGKSNKHYTKGYKSQGKVKGQRRGGKGSAGRGG